MRIFVCSIRGNNNDDDDDDDDDREWCWNADE